jgi:hypothetical protein
MEGSTSRRSCLLLRWRCRMIDNPAKRRPQRHQVITGAQRTDSRRVSSPVFETTSIAIRIANPMPVMSIVFVAGVLGLAPTPVRIPVARNAHTMVAIEIATFVDASYESSSRRAGVMRG